MKSASRHMIGIDLVRFIAAILVVICHVSFFDFLSPFPNASLGLSEATAATVPLHCGWVGVEIFFVISGLVISYSAKPGDAMRFAINRFLRLAPAAWICATISLVIYWWLQAVPVHVLVPQYLKTLCFWPLTAIDGVYWTLGVEIAFYAVVFLLIAANRLSQLERLAVLGGMVSLVFWALALSLEAVLPQLHGAFAAKALVWTHKAMAARVFQLILLQHGCFFALGVLIKGCFDRGVTGMRIAVMALMGVACSLEIIGQTDIYSRFFSLPLSPVIPLILWWLGVAMIMLSAAGLDPAIASRGRPKMVVQFMGRLTYPLYLVHMPVLILLSVTLDPRLGGMRPVLAVFGALIAAAFVERFLEPALRVRMGNLLRKPRTV